MALVLIPFVRIHTVWSDDLPTDTGHIEEWYAKWVLLTYARPDLCGAPELWLRSGEARPVRAKFFERVWLPYLEDWGPTQ